MTSILGPGFYAGFYGYSDAGDFVASDAGMAAIVGTSVETIKAQARFRMDDKPPKVWVQATRRRLREASAHLGYEPDMRQLLDWLAEE